MKTLLFAASTTAVFLGIAAPASAKAGADSPNARLFATHLVQQVECGDADSVRQQVQSQLAEIGTVGFDEAVATFSVLVEDETPCGSLADYASELTALAAADADAFMAELRLVNNRRSSRAGYKAGKRRHSATGPADAAFQLLRDDASPPASASARSTSDYGN